MIQGTPPTAADEGMGKRSRRLVAPVQGTGTKGAPQSAPIQGISAALGAASMINPRCHGPEGPQTPTGTTETTFLAWRNTFITTAEADTTPRGTEEVYGGVFGLFRGVQILGTPPPKPPPTSRAVAARRRVG